MPRYCSVHVGLLVLDMRHSVTHISSMGDITTTIRAWKLARRRGKHKGVTPPELAKQLQCSLRAAQRLLRRLAAEEVLRFEAPARAGAKRGDWRNVYTARWYWVPSPGRHARIVLAFWLADRGAGVTPVQLAKQGPCSMRAARRLLRAMAAEGLVLVRGETYRTRAAEGRRLAGKAGGMVSSQRAAARSRAGYLRVLDLLCPVGDDNAPEGEDNVAPWGRRGSSPGRRSAPGQGG